MNNTARNPKISEFCLQIYWFIGFNQLKVMQK